MNRSRLGVRVTVPRLLAFASFAILTSFGVSGGQTHRTDRTERSKKPDFELHQRQGVNSLSEGDYSKALEEFRAAIGIDPENAQAHDYAGTALATLGKNEAAAEEFQKAIQLSDDLSSAH